jgi:drug/metabolite transporter, DME family
VSAPAAQPSRRAVLGAVAAVVVAGACWGLSAVIAKIAFDRGVPPVRMAEARVVVALVLLAGILGVWRRDLFRPPPGTRAVLVGFGLSVAFVNASYYVAIDRLPVGVAISLQYTAPALLLSVSAVVAARAPDSRVSRLLVARRPGGAVWGAAVLTLVGAVLVSRAYDGFESLDAKGLLAAVGSAMFFATYLLTASLAGRRGTPAATVLFWGFVVSIVAWAVLSPWWSWPVKKLSEPEVSLSVLGVGVVGTLIPFFLAVGAVRILTPATAGIAATVEPPFAAAFAWIFLGQHLAGGQLVGGAMVLAGVALAQRSAAIEDETAAVEVMP